VAWNFAESIVKFILSPVLKFLPPDQGLVYTGLTDAFSVTFRLSLWAGAVVSAPYFFYQIWAFVAPGLHPEEKAKVPFLTILATALLLLGACFAYFAAFPMTFKFFLAFSSEEMRPLLAVDRYMSLCMGLIVAFAVAFQLPLVLMFLARLGLVTPEFLKKSRSYAVVLIFIVAAILTPPDVVSQILLAAALIFLYELSIFLIKRQNIALARAQILAEKEADSDLD
jgi:sec-independent protein translocase protein TatC